MRIASVNQDPGIRPDGKKGAAVHLAAMRDAFRRIGADVVEVDSPDDAAVTRQLERLTASGLDLIYERYALNGFAASRFAAAHGVPHVLEVNSPLADEARRYRPDSPHEVDTDHERQMFAGAARILAVSTEVARYARECGAAPERVQVAQNGVDAGRFRPLDPGDPLRSHLVPDGSFVVGFHGRLRPWHGIELLVEACRALKGRGVPVFALAVGRGDFEKHLAALGTGGFGVVDWVPHEEVGRYVGCFDVLPLTHSRKEPFYFSPLKLYEAMAACVVPVVPDLGDLPEVVQHGETGLVYPADELDELVHALARLFEEPELRSRLSKEARRHAATNTWERIAARLVDDVVRRPA